MNYGKKSKTTTKGTRQKNTGTRRVLGLTGATTSGSTNQKCSFGQFKEKKDNNTGWTAGVYRYVYLHTVELHKFLLYHEVPQVKIF